MIEDKPFLSYSAKYIVSKMTFFVKYTKKVIRKIKLYKYNELRTI